MKITAIDRSKRDTLLNELSADFPSITEGQLSAAEDSVNTLVQQISLIVHQNESAIAHLVEKKLEYICSKSI